jgi:uncharacterized SAM-binding protein YcdF (DUF218 family)
MFFPLSKIGWLLIQPIGLLGLLFAALLALSIRRSAWLIAWLAAAGLGLVLGTSQTNIGKLALQPLENFYERPAAMPLAGEVAGIIVLGGGFEGDVTRLRGGFELGESGDRFVEAVRLARLYPKVPVVVSGGEASLIGETEGDAAISKRFFDAFGVAADRLILEDRSMNTYQNAAYTKAVLPKDATGKWLLVTSAFHMPRSAAAFRKQGIDFIAWPVDYRTTGRERFEIGRDDAIQAFAEVSLAMREWVGLAVYAATGRIDGILRK